MLHFTDSENLNGGPAFGQGKEKRGYHSEKKLLFKQGTGSSTRVLMDTQLKEKVRVNILSPKMAPAGGISSNIQYKRMTCNLAPTCLPVRSSANSVDQVPVAGILTHAPAMDTVV